VVVADDCTEFAFDALSVAVLAYAAQLAVEVALVMCTDAAALAARFPKLQVSTPLAIKHVPGPLYAGLIDQFTPVPDGRVSLNAAEVAVPDPELFAASVYPIEEPAETVAASAAFVRLRVGHCTVVVADDCTELAFDALRVAVFAYAAQLAEVVELSTCTLAEAPGPRFPKLHVRTCPEIEHVPGPLYAGLIDQLTPVPEGSVSLSVAAVAVPELELLAASVKPIVEPAETVAASAVFERLSAAHATVVVAEDCSVLLLVALRVAVLE
jgi:hypothetical protein